MLENESHSLEEDGLKALRTVHIATERNIRKNTDLQNRCVSIFPYSKMPQLISLSLYDLWSNYPSDF